MQNYTNFSLPVSLFNNHIPPPEPPAAQKGPPPPVRPRLRSQGQVLPPVTQVRLRTLSQGQLPPPVAEKPSNNQIRVRNYGQRK